MTNLRFRAPGRGGKACELVARAWPWADPRQLRSAFERGEVKVAREVVSDPELFVAGGAAIQVVASEGSRPRPTPEVSILQRGEDFCVVHKPAGWPGHAATGSGPDARIPVAAALGRSQDEIWPVQGLDAEISGAWLLALSKEAAVRLSKAFDAPGVREEYRALAPTLPWPEGRLTAGIDGKAAETRFSTVVREDGWSELCLTPVTKRTHQLRLHLAGAGAPLLGDALFGGILLEGGLRLYCRRLAIAAEGVDATAPEPPGFRPSEPVFPPPRGRVVVTVSHATVVALKRGHPWILTDGETSDVGGERPGTLARVKSVRGEECGLCRIEGPGRIAARAWPVVGAGGNDLGPRLEAALARRADLIRGREGRQATTSFRLVHGEADGFPGLMIDLLGDELRVLTPGRACEPLLDAVVDGLRDLVAADAAVVQVRHLAERPKGELLSVEAIRGTPQPGAFFVREQGLRFEVENGLREPFRSRPGFGLFVDQRQNRRRVARHVQTRGGGRWLNLFCHTGSFSVVALAAGADHVTSVDLSAPYLKTLARNLAANELDAQRHESVKMDAERYLERLPPRERFDGIVLDPPTAAAAGRRFWSARKRQASLIESCLRRLNPDGVLLACRNLHNERVALGDVARAAASAARIRLRSVENAPPGPDFPRLRGFPEGDAFEGVWVTVESFRHKRAGSPSPA